MLFDQYNRLNSSEANCAQDQPTRGESMQRKFLQWQEALDVVDIEI